MQPDKKLDDDVYHQQLRNKIKEAFTIPADEWPPSIPDYTKCKLENAEDIFKERRGKEESLFGEWVKVDQETLSSIAFDFQKEFPEQRLSFGIFPPSQI